MGMIAELVSVWPKTIMRPLLVCCWRPGPNPGEEDCLKPDRGNRPRRAASAARAATWQRQMASPRTLCRQNYRPVGLRATASTGS